MGALEKDHNNNENSLSVIRVDNIQKDSLTFHPPHLTKLIWG